jgi:hypothetical protein
LVAVIGVRHQRRDELSRSAVVALVAAACVAVPASALGETAQGGGQPDPSGAGAAPHPAAIAPDDEEVSAPSEAPGRGSRLYGFADLGYSKVLTKGFGDGHEVVSTISGAPQHWAFAVGNLNLYVDSQPSTRLRSLAEARLTYFPSGSQSTTVPDYAQALATTSWGAIVIERAWVEYAFSDLLTLRAGQFLTPYGIWNVDHGSPTTIAVQKPEIASAELFPERQVGLEAYGTRYLGDTRLGYHLTVSNGRIGNNPPFANYSGRPGLGARLFLEGDWLGELRLGVSAYTGRYTELHAGDTSAVPTPPDSVAVEYDEHDVAADVRWEWKRLLLASEAVYQRVGYTDRGRPTDAFLGPAGPVATPASDFWRAGSYVLAGVRLPLEVMPYAMGEFIYQSTGIHLNGLLFPSGFRAVSAGVNFRPLASLVLKVQYDHIWAPNFALLPNKMDLLRSQIAWVF